MRWVHRIDGAGRERMALGIFVALSAIYLLTATYDAAQITDTRASAITAWSLGEGDGFTLPAEWEDIPWRSVSVDGEVLTNRFPGASVLAAPFYMIWPVDSDPQRAFDVPYAPAGVASAIMAAAAMAVLFVVLDDLVSRRAALVTTLLVGLGTATWSVSADSLFTHAPGQLALVLALLAVRRARWAWAGLAFGVAVLVRPQLAVIAAVVGVGLALSRRSWRPMLGIGVWSMPGVLALAAYSRHFFGSWVPIAGYSPTKLMNVGAVADPTRGAGWVEDLSTLFEHWGLTLFHPLRGLFLYSPFLLVLVLFAILAWRCAPDWARWSAVAGVVVMAVQLLANPTWQGGDDFFAYRLPLEMVTVAAPLLGVGTQRALEGGRWPRFALVLTGAASIAMFSLGSTVFDPRTPEREEYFQMVEELGPHGEGYDVQDAVGPDASGDSGQ